MTIDKEKIRSAAMAATQGEWKQEGRTVYALMHEGWRRGVENFKNRFYLQVQFDRDCPESEAEANATHIATSNPSTVLSLLDALDKAEKERDELHAALEQFATWGYMQHKAQSKGGHATFDMMSLRDEISLAEAAIKSVKGGE